jgi:hypothetical protein
MIAAPANLAQDPAALAALIERVYMNSQNTITGRDVLLLRNAVDDLRGVEQVCVHQNIDVYQFNADRFSGNCRDCGADVRSPA